MRDAQAEAAAELLQDRFELLRLRTLFVGALGILILIVSLIVFFGYGSKALILISHALTANTNGFHVPSNLFQAPVDTSWARSPFLLQLAFVVIGISGISYMTRQVLSNVQIRVWVAVLGVLALCIVYMQSDIGSVWHSSQRDLIKAVNKEDWSRVEQLSLESRNSLGHGYVMAQVAIAKSDQIYLKTHSKLFVDVLDNMLMRRGFYAETIDGGLLKTADDFKPQILKTIDIAIYGAPHTQIGLSLVKLNDSSKQEAGIQFREFTGIIMIMALAIGGVVLAYVLFKLWRRMTHRLRWLKPWVDAAY
jgi:hypothetical protein